MDNMKVINKLTQMDVNAKEKKSFVVVLPNIKIM